MDPNPNHCCWVKPIVSLTETRMTVSISSGSNILDLRSKLFKCKICSGLISVLNYELTDKQPDGQTK